MNVLELFKPVTTFIFDVDGVLTDGTVMVMNVNLQVRRMNIKDGFALQMAVANGYRVKIISGGNSREVAQRLEKLGVTDVEMSVYDKAAVVKEYMRANNLNKEEVLYMGDDMPDVTALQEAGLACCPADAVPEVKQVSQYISPFNGGFACVRDVIEKVMKLQDKWQYNPDITSR